MTGLEGLGRILLFVGAGIVLLGLILLVAGRVPFLGRLPGDIVFQRDGATFYFPLVTMIIVSIVLTILLNVIFRILR